MEARTSHCGHDTSPPTSPAAAEAGAPPPVTTGLYVLLWHLRGPFWAWAVVSLLLGLGFTFFSGAVDAWLVDALGATGFAGSLDAVFARAQIASGVATLTGSVAGGYIAQAT